MFRICFVDDDEEFEIPLFCDVFGEAFDIIAASNYAALKSQIDSRENWKPDLFVLDLYFPSGPANREAVEALRAEPLFVENDNAEIRTAYRNYLRAKARLAGVLDAWKQNANGGLLLAEKAVVDYPADVKTLSGTELRERLSTGREIPAWFSFPEVIDELRRTYPPRSKQGFTVFFTGLPSSGKSTLANVLLVKLLEAGGQPVTLLDGDIVRKNLSSELGFSKEHRDLNIQRIGFVASEITKNFGVAICAPIAPYESVRKQVRQMVEAGGGFILVHVATPVEVCEQRDRKGLYAKARAGIIKEFTGISDPYEEPDDADVVLDTTDSSPEECVQAVILHLEKEGYISSND